MVDSPEESLEVFSKYLKAIHFHELNQVGNRDCILSQRDLTESIGLDEVWSLKQSLLNFVSLQEEPGFVLQMLGNRLLCLLLQWLVYIVSIGLAPVVADVSQGTVGRGKEDLAELIEVQIAISISIEFLYNQLSVSLRKLHVMFFQKLEDLLSIDLPILVRV